MPEVIGWDIGGVNLKGALVADGSIRGVLTRPFELQRAPHALPEVLAGMAAALNSRATIHAVTMTAELSQMFRTRREGVSFVLDAVERAFPGAAIHVYTTMGAFIPTSEARDNPIAVAAANWVATAHIVALHQPDTLLIDVGTTTTDVIPIGGGHVAAAGRTDVDRLTASELVYTGAVRTPVEAIVRHVPVSNGVALVSAEGFALSGDVHVWLGSLDPDDYDAATPDGRPSTREFCGERLARVVCADREMLDDAAITRIANAIAEEQVAQIAVAIRSVVSRHDSLTTAVVTGLGAFLGASAARRAGLSVVPLSARLGDSAARSAPAAAVALLLAAGLDGRPALAGATPQACARPPAPTLVKLGGSLLAHPDEWRAAVAAIDAAAASQAIVIIPGGGPFADAVRGVDARVGLSNETAHWMAIAGMDQHAEMIAAAGSRLARVVDETGARAALGSGQGAVIAPLRWLRSADPLPHSWDVTSDSIAAWFAAAFGAARLLLVKPGGADGPDLVDRYFQHATSPAIPWTTCDASALTAHLRAGEPAPR
jgi:probable H4MPT-linked C1 transfer pathway protein